MKGLPVGIQTFEEVIKQNKLYIDKTELIYNLSNRFKYVFLSRPRRFGKSLLVSTMKAYFEGRKDLFAGTAIADLENDWEVHPVVVLSLAIRSDSVANLKLSIHSVLADNEKYLDIPNGRETEPLNVRLKNIVKNAFQKTGRQVVLLIDEYDAPMLNTVSDEVMFAETRKVLNDLFSPIKDLDPYLKFVFITGISKFSQMSIFSVLNNLMDISLVPDYEAICGFTKEELRACFVEYAQALAEKNGTDTDRVFQQMKEYYDGYHFSDEMTCDVFNPFSVLKCFALKKFGSYWFDSASPSALISLVSKFDLDFNTYENVLTDSSRFSKPLERITDPIPLLFQSGYLSIKDYEPEDEQYTLSYPNTEVRKAFAEQLVEYRSDDPDNRTNFKNSYISFKKDDDIDKFLLALKAFYAGFPYTLDNSAKNEKHYHGLFYTALVAFGADVTVNPETALGKADIVLKMRNTIYVMELKYKRCTQAAKSQIQKRDYCSSYLSDPRHVIMVGINFTEKENGYFVYDKEVVKG